MLGITRAAVLWGRLGPELIGNGQFIADAAGWTAVNSALSVVNGELVVTGSGGAYPGAYRDFPCVVGKRYQVSVSLRRGTTDSQVAAVIQTTGGGNVTSPSTYNDTTMTTRNFEFVATQAMHRFTVYIVNGAGSGTAIFDALSVRQKK